MALVNFVISTVGKCMDAACLLLDLNFLIVHTVIRTILAVITFITCLPTHLLDLLVGLVDLMVFGLISVAETASAAAHGVVIMLGSLVLALEGLLESLKMMGYLSMHVLLRGKDHVCRGLLSVLEGCGIIASLVVYFANTLVNISLIATQNIYQGLVSVYQAVTSPLQKVLELTLTSFTFLYSSLLGTSAFLWSPCKLVLDVLISLLRMLISIFILNTRGFLLTVTIALTTTAYLNPELTRQATVRIVNYFPVLRKLLLVLHHLSSALQNVPHVVNSAIQYLLRHLYLLERELKRHLSLLSSQLGLALRAQLHRDNNNNRAHGDGDAGEEQGDQPDGRAGDEANQELLDSVLPSSSTDRQLKKPPSSSKGSKHLPAGNLLTLLKEQENRKQCVICQDSIKTVVLLPCRHLCLCRDCTNILLRQPIYQQNCPLCRRMILNTMDVFL